MTPLWLRNFTKFVAAATLFLIFAGAMVTSTGSGLAVPDWPLSFGMLMPPMVGGIFYEHGHRMIAATVGFLVVIQALWLSAGEPKRFVRLLGWSSLGGDRPGSPRRPDREALSAACRVDRARRAGGD